PGPMLNHAPAFCSPLRTNGQRRTQRIAVFMVHSTVSTNNPASVAANSELESRGSIARRDTEPGSAASIALQFSPPSALRKTLVRNEKYRSLVLFGSIASEP